jgi:hypothetical protein
MNMARLLAYADDNFLQGGPEPTMRAFQALTALAAFLKLFPQPGKCAVYSAYALTTSVATQLGVRESHEGLLAAGTPVGTRAFHAAHANVCADHACLLMDDLQAVLLVEQDRWFLLHGSVQ